MPPPLGVKEKRNTVLIVTDRPVVNIAGCPPIGDVVTATVVHYLTFGRLPQTDGEGFSTGYLVVYAVAWALLEAQRLWAQHGPAADLMGCLCNFGSMLISRRRDYRTAYDITRHVIAVGEACGFEARTAATR